MDPEPDPPPAVFADSADLVADLYPLDLVLGHVAGSYRPDADALLGDGHVHPEQKGQKLYGRHQDGHDAEHHRVGSLIQVQHPLVGQDGEGFDDEHQQCDPDDA